MHEVYIIVREPGELLKIVEKYSDAKLILEGAGMAWSSDIVCYKGDMSTGILEKIEK